MDKEFRLETLKSAAYWVEETELQHIPLVMRKEYALLKQSVRSKDVCGAMFRIKDLCEISMKIPVIMSVIAITYYMESRSGFVIKDITELRKENETSQKGLRKEAEKSDVLQKFVELLLKMYGTPLSIGNWNDLINLLISNSNIFELDATLKQILDKTKVLIHTKIGEYRSIPNWRNKVMGHGTLAIDTDRYWDQIEDLVLALKKYFEGVDREDRLDFLYEKAYIDDTGRTMIVNGVHYPISIYVHAHADKNLYYFDSFFSNKKMVEITDYVTAPSILAENEQYVKIYEKCSVYKHAKGQKKVRRITNSEEREKFACLHHVSKFMEPKYVIRKISEFMEKNSRGVLCLEMEQGMGKSVLAHYLDGRYQTEIVTKPLHAVVRVYHIRDMQFRHEDRKTDFFTALEANLKAYSGVKTLEVDEEEYEDANGNHLRELMKKGGMEGQKGFAELLHMFRLRYEEEAGAEDIKFVYIIDGIDELNADTRCILDSLPSDFILNSFDEQELNHVYILLFSRMRDEIGLSDTARECIEYAEQLAGGNIIRFHSHNEAYLELLREYMKKNYGVGSRESCERMIDHAERKFLYIRPYMAMGEQVMKTEAAVAAAVVAGNYIELLLTSYYGASRHNVYLVLSAIALFGSVSIKKICDLIFFTEVTYDCIGIINDILPLLIVKRTERENEYAFANEEYAEYILSKFKDPVTEVVFRFRISVIHWAEQMETNRKNEISAEAWADHVSKILRMDHWFLDHPSESMETDRYINALLTIHQKAPDTIYACFVKKELERMIYKYLQILSFSPDNRLSERRLLDLGLDGRLGKRDTELQKLRYDVSMKWAGYCRKRKAWDDLWVRLLFRQKAWLGNSLAGTGLGVYQEVIKEWHDEGLVNHLIALTEEEMEHSPHLGHGIHLEFLLQEVQEEHLQKKLFHTLIGVYRSYAGYRKNKKRSEFMEEQRKREICGILESAKRYHDPANDKYIDEMLEVYRPGVGWEQTMHACIKELKSLADNSSAGSVITCLEKLEEVKRNGQIWGWEKDAFQAGERSEALYREYQRTQVEVTNRLLDHITVMYHAKQYEEVKNCLHHLSCARCIESYEREDRERVESWLGLYAEIAELSFRNGEIRLLRDLELNYRRVLHFYDACMRTVPLGIYSDDIYLEEVDPSQRLHEWEKTYILRCSSFRYEVPGSGDMPYMVSISLCKYLQELYEDHRQEEYDQWNQRIEAYMDKNVSIQNILSIKNISSMKNISWGHHILLSSQTMQTLLWIDHWQCVRYYRSLEKRDARSSTEWEARLRDQFSVRWNEIQNAMCHIREIQHDRDQEDALKFNITGILYFSKMLPDTIAVTEEIRAVLLDKIHALKSSEEESMVLRVWLDRLLDILNDKNRWFHTRQEFKVSMIRIPFYGKEHRLKSSE